MKNVKLSGVIFLLNLFAPYIVSAQQGRNLDDHVLIKMSQQSVFETEVYEGSPYSSETFINGDVYTFGGMYKDVPLRYNVYKNNVEFKKNNQIYILDPSVQINKIIIDKDTLVVQKYPFRGAVKLGFLSLLDSGKVLLLSKSVVSYRQAQPPKPLEPEGKPARYSTLPDIYYLKIGEGEANEITNLKTLIQRFPDKHNELNEFADREKISTRKKEDLIKLVRYYNSL